MEQGGAGREGLPGHVQLPFPFWPADPVLLQELFPFPGWDPTLPSAGLMPSDFQSLPSSRSVTILDITGAFLFLYGMRAL